MSQMEKYADYFSEIPGWFEKPAIAVWDTFLTWQAERDVKGDFLEIGVWKGRSAALMALHCREEESCLFVDIQALDEARSHITDRLPRTTCIYLQRSSQFLMNEPSLRDMPGRFRWIHIDGEHTSEAVIRDLESADMFMTRDGIVVLDDFFSAAYPQVTQAVFQYLLTRPSRFTLILCGFNKGYLCRPIAARQYLERINNCLYHDLELRGVGNITIWKTTEPGDMFSFGITDRHLNFDYRGPDWGETNIPV